MNGLFEQFSEFRKILYVCPCCGEIKRVSELKLFVKGMAAAHTWLDTFEKKVNALDKAEERFEEKKKDIMKEATKEGQKETEKAFTKVLPIFKNLNPYDVKSLLHPVDFVVFNGMKQNKDNDKGIKTIMFLSRKTNIDVLKPLRKQVNEAVLKKNYTWQLARVNDDGGIGYV